MINEYENEKDSYTVIALLFFLIASLTDSNCPATLVLESNDIIISCIVIASIEPLGVCVRVWSDICRDAEQHQC